MEQVCKQWKNEKRKEKQNCGSSGTCKLAYHNGG